MASEGEPHGQAVERIAFISGYHLTSVWRLRASPMASCRVYCVYIWLPSHFCMASEGEPLGQAIDRVVLHTVCNSLSGLPCIVLCIY